MMHTAPYLGRRKRNNFRHSDFSPTHRSFKFCRATRLSSPQVSKGTSTFSWECRNERWLGSPFFRQRVGGAIRARYGSRVRGGDRLNLSLTAVEKRRQRERERRVWDTFDSLGAESVLAPWLIHWLVHLQRATPSAIRHSVMSQCYKYSHAFPTTFPPPRKCLSSRVSRGRGTQSIIWNAVTQRRPGRIKLWGSPRNRGKTVRESLRSRSQGTDSVLTSLRNKAINSRPDHWRDNYSRAGTGNDCSSFLTDNGCQRIFRGAREPGVASESRSARNWPRSLVTDELSLISETLGRPGSRLNGGLTTSGEEERESARRRQLTVFPMDLAQPYAVATLHELDRRKTVWKAGGFSVKPVQPVSGRP